MSEAKHTPGPWHVGSRGGYNALTIYAYNGASQHEDQGICDVFGIPLRWMLEQVENDKASQIGLANAKLIAAAPELLAACEGVTQILSDLIDYVGGNTEAMEAALKIDAAIKQAKGETK